MKSDQLIECNMLNIFLKESYSVCGGITIPIIFSKKSKLAITLDQWPKFLFNLS